MLSCYSGRRRMRGSLRREREQKLLAVVRRIGLEIGLVMRGAGRGGVRTLGACWTICGFCCLFQVQWNV